MEIQYIDKSGEWMCLLKHWGLLVSIATCYIKVETERVGRSEHPVISRNRIVSVAGTEKSKNGINCR
jgi:hypothetical protein